MRKIILITGSSGLCGSYLTEFFEKTKEFEVYSTSRKTKSRENHLIRDLSKTIPKNIFPQKIDFIIHCAFNVNQNNNDFNVINQNLQITKNLLEYAKLSNVKGIINFSSVSIYGFERKNFMFTEMIPAFPSTYYGISKFLVEKIFNYLQNSIKISNLRLGYVLSRCIPERYFISRFIKKLKNNDSIELINPNTTRFNFIFINDIAKLCKLIIYKEKFETYNIVNDENPTLKKVFNEIKKHYPKSNSTITESFSQKIELSNSYSNEKIKNEFNFTFTTFQDTLQKILKTC